MQKQELIKNIRNAFHGVQFQETIPEAKIDRAVKFIASRSQNFQGVSEERDFFDFNGKIAQTAEQVGAEVPQMQTAGLKQPQIFVQSPEKINRNITRLAELLGVEKERMVEAALKTPSLFCRDPYSVEDNYNAIVDAHAKGYFHSNNLLEDVLNNSVVLTLSRDNTHLRSLEAHLADEHNSISSLGISNFYKGRGRSKSEITKSIAGYYTKSFNDMNAIDEKGDHKITLSDLVEAGLITEEELPQFDEEPELGELPELA